MRHFSPVCALALVFLTTGLVYQVALPGNFLFDDQNNLVTNQFLSFDPTVLDQWRTAIFSSDAGPMKRPFSMFTFALNVSVDQELDPGSIKFVNIVLHLIAAGLVYLLANEIFRKVCIAAPAALSPRSCAILCASLWMLHPLHVSTVLYPIQRMAILSAVFVLLGLFLFFRARSRWALAGARDGDLPATLLWLAIILFLGILSKENGLLLIWLIGLCEIFFFRGMWSGRKEQNVLVIGWLLFLAPLVALSLVFVANPDLILSGYTLRPFDLGERLLTQARVLWLYLGWLLVPNLSQYGIHHDDIAVSTSLMDPLSTMISLAAWAGLAGVLFVFRRHLGVIAFAILFFLVAHSMESSILALEMTYEHRNYLPSVGIAIGFTYLISRMPYRFVLNGAPIAFAALCVGILLTLLVFRTQIWSSNYLITRHGIENHPESPRSHYFYALELIRMFREESFTDPISDREKRALAELIRHHFLVMRSLDPLDLAAPIMLLEVDSALFSDAGTQEAWLNDIQSTVSSKTLYPSDYAAIDVFAACATSGKCGTRGMEVLSEISESPAFESDVRLRFARYRYLAASGQNPRSLKAYLDDTLQSHPAWLPGYFYAIEEANRLGDVAAMYRYAGQWLLYDAKRQHIHTLVELFE